MAFTLTSVAALNKVVPPALPNSTSEYSSQYQDQLNNILRLYFNQLQGILGQIDSNESYIPATKVYTVATLPSATTASKGARGFVSDALAPTFGASVVGGGAVAVPVYSDGSAWKVG